jgi:serine protease Do
MQNNQTDNTPEAPRVSSGTSDAIGKKRPKTNRAAVIIAALLLALGGGIGGGWIAHLLDDNETTETTIQPSSKNDGNAITTPGEETIAAVAKAVSPSIVSVLTSSRTTSIFNDTIEQEGAGTGMIVSKNGYVMTNKHVIQDADTVTVILPDGKTYQHVQVLGSDPLNDVAFLKISGVNDLPAVTLGDSKTIRIGQSVVAIGNALGQYQNSVTSGIISGTGRPVVASSNGSSTGTQENLTDLIQTDAAINSGNSGGPLLNLKGQVIGINTAIAQDAQSIGFAIPIGATKGLLNHVIRTGKIARSYLGVQYVSITADVKTRYNLPVSRGDYIVASSGKSVQPNGPAAKAGVQDRDIIVGVNGFKVGEIASISTLISEYQPGDKVQLTILRGGRSLTLTATLGTYKD